MRYNETYRACAVAFKDQGHTFKELKSVFGVSDNSYRNWKKLKEKTGFYAPKPTIKATRKRKIDPEKLNNAVQENPGIYLRELAEQFNCSTTAIHKQLKKHNITLKKRRSPTPRSPQKTAPIISKK